MKGPLVYQAELHHLMTRAIGRMFILHGALAKANGITEEVRSVRTPHDKDPSCASSLYLYAIVSLF